MQLAIWPMSTCLEESDYKNIFKANSTKELKKISLKRTTARSFLVKQPDIVNDDNTKSCSYLGTSWTRATNWAWQTLLTLWSYITNATSSSICAWRSLRTLWSRATDAASQTSKTTATRTTSVTLISSRSLRSNVSRLSNITSWSSWSRLTLKMQYTKIRMAWAIMIMSQCTSNHRVSQYLSGQFRITFCPFLCFEINLRPAADSLLYVIVKQIFWEKKQSVRRCLDEQQAFHGICTHMLKEHKWRWKKVTNMIISDPAQALIRCKFVLHARMTLRESQCETNLKGH